MSTSANAFGCVGTSTQAPNMDSLRVSGPTRYASCCHYPALTLSDHIRPPVLVLCRRRAPLRLACKVFSFPRRSLGNFRMGKYGGAIIKFGWPSRATCSGLGIDLAGSPRGKTIQTNGLKTLRIGGITSYVPSSALSIIPSTLTGMPERCHHGCCSHVRQQPCRS